MTIATAGYAVMPSGEVDMSVASHQNHDFDAKIVMIKSLLEGDTSVVEQLYKHYSFISTESCRYMFYKLLPSIPYEDVEQQAHFELVNILSTKIPGSGKDWLTDVNIKEGYKPCLAIRGYLIKSVRSMLKAFIIESTGVIRIHKVIYEKDYIKDHGDPNPVKCISSTAETREGIQFELPGAIPIDYLQPIENAIAEEIRRALCLTPVEEKILEMRLEGIILEKIASEVGKSRGTLFRMIQDIQARYARWKRKNA